MTFLRNPKMKTKTYTAMGQERTTKEREHVAKKLIEQLVEKYTQKIDEMEEDPEKIDVEQEIND